MRVQVGAVADLALEVAEGRVLFAPVADESYLAFSAEWARVSRVLRVSFDVR